MSFLSRLFKKRAKKEENPTTAKPSPQGVILRHDPDSDKVIFKDLVLFKPDGTPLVDYGSLTLGPGDRMLITGAAGSGKSAGLSAMRNAWLLGGSGEIIVPPEIRFVPQDDYFPDRSLRGIVCAPDPISRYTREEVAQALTDAGLGQFIDEMDDTNKRGEYWKNTLSGGQKNKVGFAGIFLHAKEVKVLIVDEITAALDAKSEADLYPKLMEKMKHGIVIAIAHRVSIMPQHNIFAMVANRKVEYKTSLPSAVPAREDNPPADVPKPS